MSSKQNGKRKTLKLMLLWRMMMVMAMKKGKPAGINLPVKLRQLLGSVTTIGEVKLLRVEKGMTKMRRKERPRVINMEMKMSKRKALKLTKRKERLVMATRKKETRTMKVKRMTERKRE